MFNLNYSRIHIQYAYPLTITSLQTSQDPLVSIFILTVELLGQDDGFYSCLRLRTQSPMVSHKNKNHNLLGLQGLQIHPIQIWSLPTNFPHPLVEFIKFTYCLILLFPSGKITVSLGICLASIGCPSSLKCLLFTSLMCHQCQEPPYHWCGTETHMTHSLLKLTA